MTATALGEQLGFTFPEATLNFAVTYVGHGRIRPDPDQPRKHPDRELVESIRANGILQPITVRPDPERRGDLLIVDGERRWRGAEGVLEEIAVLIREDLDIRPTRLRTQLVANVGKPLTPIEEAKAFAELLPEHSDSIAELARALGRPERSVGERLQLLELGPWIPMIEDGRLPLSHAVRTLLPLRGCSTEVHESVISRMGSDFRFTRNLSGKEGAAGISAHDFASLIRQLYESSVYPLTKSSGYGRQPTFNTSKHDAECPCGRVLFEMSGHGAKRACCGNPGWWRPLHRAANKAKPKKRTATSGYDGRPQAAVFHMPHAAKTVAKATPGLTPLTDTRYGQRPIWDCDSFDPAALASTLSPEHLVLVKAPSGQYSGTFVATSNSAAVSAARKAWADRWSARRAKTLEQARRAFTAKGKGYAVRGAGLGELLPFVEIPDPSDRGSRSDLLVVIDAALVAEVKGIPESLSNAFLIRNEYDRGNAVRASYAKWIAALDQSDAEAVATALAFLLATKTRPSAVAGKELDAERARIRKGGLPWLSAKGRKRRPSVEVMAALDPEDVGVDGEDAEFVGDDDE